ncbi:efflux RND transporter permease subunit [Fibrella sp. WM1]|uniref:Efflux RND transporter permease subunit n=1 Tax=Spirosoma sordidisoli TaxID=2502893 RepID=A0A4Q2UC71_9BACT|nr:efflux RND transporter permease subunit [Spirosoma sordidisoli]RYC66703.1 efflux RND transporter permease subunit [Spirosoma sordidisoli]
MTEQPSASATTTPTNEPVRRSYFEVFSRPILFTGVLLLIAGIYAYTRMQTNLFPEVLFPRVSIIVDNGQQPIDRMMITVTKPLESAVKKVNGVTIVKSSTSRGSCTIDVFFKWGQDIYTQKTQVESRINEIRNFLPPGVNLSIEAMNQSLFPVYGYTLESDQHGLVALRDRANLLVRPLFSQVSGIANVVVRGGKAKEIVVIPDAVKLASVNLPISALITAINANNNVLSNGYVADYRRLYLTLTDTRVLDVDALNALIVKNDGTRMVTLGEVARVEVQEQQQEFLVINANGHQAVQIDLVKQPGVNLIDFAKNAEAKAVEVRKILPRGMRLKPYYDQSAFVGDSVHSVIKTIYEGLLLAILVMIVFLRSWRASTVVLLTIPVTLAFTILVLYVVGISINIMSLGAIAASIGLIIDDAIVIIEQIYRVHEEEPEKNRFAVVQEALHNLFPAMVGSSLSTIVIHFPFRLMSGLAGSFFRELSDTMQITMVCSFLVTWLLLPVLHLLIGFKASKNAHAVDEFAQVRRLYWLTQLFTKPVVSLLLVGLLGFGAWFSYGRLETGFLPDLDEGTIVLDYFTPPGTSIQETDRILRQAEKIIVADSNVATYSRRTGISMGFRGVPPNFGDYSIQLKTNRTKTTVEVIDDLRTRINAAQPVLSISFGQRIADLLGDLMSTPQPIEIKLFGDNYILLQTLSKQASGILETIPGVVDVNDGLVEAGPSLVFEPDQAKLSQYKIGLIDFQTQLTAYTGGVSLGPNAAQPVPSPAQAALTAGIQVGSFQDGEQMRRMVLRFANFDQNDLDKLRNVLIFLPDGTTRPLSFFCRVTVLGGEIEQRREDLKSSVVLTARLNGRDLGSTIRDIQTQFAQKLPLPQGYTVGYGGAYAQQQQSFGELLLILTLASLLVLAVLMFLFKDWWLSVLVLLLSLLGITGCITALYLTGIPLNVSSYTGIIMIVGIIAENAIFTVNQFEHTLARTGDVDESVNYAIALRLRPKLMTAIGAILALMPLALGFGLGAQMQQPLAVAVIGGFVAGLPLLLLVLPTALRALFHRRVIHPS